MAGTFEGFKLKKGSCRIVWSSGSSFEGICANGRRSKGEMKWVNNNCNNCWKSWKGGFNADDKMSGEGELHWENGQYFNGKLSDS
jgi:hypothetical protein